jgi:hypothetical protein
MKVEQEAVSGFSLHGTERNDPLQQRFFIGFQSGWSGLPGRVLKIPRPLRLELRAILP